MRFFQIFIVFTCFFICDCYASSKEISEGEVSSSMAYSLQESKVLYSKNELTLLNPASTLKAVTALVALEKLGSDFVFSTKLYSDQSDENLYLELDGNPYLEFSDLKQLFSHLEKKDYKHLYIVYNDDEDEFYSNGSNIEDTKFCFLAPSSQISLNQNCEVFNLIESTSSYSASKADFSVKLVENFSLLDEKSKEDSELDLKYLGGNEYKLIGNSKKSDLPKKLNIAVQDPKKFLLKALVQIEKEMGVSLKEKKFINKTPTKLRLISQSNSPVLVDMLKVMMKKSDNHIADAIFKKISGYYSFKKAAKVFDAEISKINKSIKFKFVDGSGISVHNLVSAKAMVEILKYGFSKDKLKEDFLSVFPSSTDDKTKFSKYVLDDLKLHAKTGSLESTTTLVGLINGEEKGAIVFATFINNSLEAKPKNRDKNAKFVNDIILSTFK